jgi:hypothetical protein
MPYSQQEGNPTSIQSKEGRMGRLTKKIKSRKEKGGSTASTVITIIVAAGIIIGIGFLVGRFILEWSVGNSLLFSPVLFGVLGIALFIWNLVDD